MPTFTKGLGLLGPDTAMLKRPRVQLPTLDYTTLLFNYLDMFGPVEDQGGTSECWCYSVAGLFEAYHYRRTGSRLVISKRALASITNARVSPGNTQDQGGLPSDAVTTLESGYVLASAWPDDTSDDSIQMDPVTPGLVQTDFKAESVLSVGSDIASVVIAGHQKGPVAICVGFPNEWYNGSPLDSTGFALQLQDPSNIVGYHAMGLLAKAPANHFFNGSPGLAMLRNSWGSWGGGRAPAGYIWVRDTDLAAILTDGNCCMDIPPVPGAARAVAAAERLVTSDAGWPVRA